MDTDVLAAERRRASCPVPATVSEGEFVCAVDLDFRNGSYTRTKEPAVFVKSPANQAKVHRKSVQPMLNRAVSAPHERFHRRKSTVDVLTAHHEAGGDDGSHDEEDSQAYTSGCTSSTTANGCTSSSTACREIDLQGSDGVLCAGPDEQGFSQSLHRVSTESNALHPTEERSSSGSEDSDDESDDEESDEEEDEDEEPIEWNSEASLKIGIKKRASEQVRMFQLKSVNTRQQLRYSDPTCDAATRMLQRRQVGAEAMKFSEVYATTLDIMEEHMTLEPPARRRHSVEISELAAYHAPPPNSDEAMATRPMSAMHDCSHGE